MTVLVLGSQQCALKQPLLAHILQNYDEANRKLNLTRNLPTNK